MANTRDTLIIFRFASSLGRRVNGRFVPLSCIFAHGMVEGSCTCAARIHVHVSYGRVICLDTAIITRLSRYCTLLVVSEKAFHRTFHEIGSIHIHPFDVSYTRHISLSLRSTLAGVRREESSRSRYTEWKYLYFRYTQ